MNYLKDAFYPRDIDHAKEICLSPDLRIPNKFEKETELTIETLVSNLYAHNNSVVLDFGCGVGRLSKGLIQRLGCDVVGVDFSEPMLHTASEYVMSRKFMPLLSPITDTIKLDSIKEVIFDNNVMDVTDKIHIENAVIKDEAILSALLKVKSMIDPFSALSGPVKLTMRDNFLPSGIYICPLPSLYK